MTLDETVLPAVDAARGRLLDAEHAADRARVDFHHGIRRLHAAGGSLREIAEHFGLSHQRVHQIVDRQGEAPRRVRSGLIADRILGRVRDWGGFTRFTAGARAVVVRAQEEAAGLGHGQIGREHLLLGLLRGDDDEPAAQVLHGLGIGVEDARAVVTRHVGACEPGADATHLPFTPRAKKVLELSLREALVLSDDHVGTEHVLLGLLRESSGLAPRVLRDLGTEPGQIRAELRRVLGSEG